MLFHSLYSKENVTHADKIDKSIEKYMDLSIIDWKKKTMPYANTQIRIVIFYKWASLKNCTKLHCQFHKWVKVIAFPCTLKQIPILFLLDSITDPVISGFERAEFTSSCNTHIMCQWHQQPVPPDSLCRAYLVAAQCQFILALPEKYFDWPPAYVTGQDFIGW